MKRFMIVLVCIISLIFVVALSEAQEAQWTGEVSTGLIFHDGKNDNLLTKTEGRAQRQTDESLLRLGVDVLYSQDDGETETENIRIYEEFEVCVTDKIYAVGNASYTYDYETGLDRSLSGYGGAGFYFMKDNQGFFSLDAGPMYTMAKFNNGYMDDSTIGCVRQRYEYQLNDLVGIEQSLSYLTDAVHDTDDYSVVGEATAKIKLVDDLCLKVAVVDTYINLVPESIDHNDIYGVVGLAYNF